MKQISLIKKAHELGLCIVSKHPITSERLILPPDQDIVELTSEWEELQDYANNRRNIKLNLKIDAKSLSKTSKPKGG